MKTKIGKQLSCQRFIHKFPLLSGCTSAGEEMEKQLIDRKKSR